MFVLRCLGTFARHLDGADLAYKHELFGGTLEGRATGFPGYIPDRNRGDYNPANGERTNDRRASQRVPKNLNVSIEPTEPSEQTVVLLDRCGVCCVCYAQRSMCVRCFHMHAHTHSITQARARERERMFVAVNSHTNASRSHAICTHAHTPCQPRGERPLPTHACEFPKHTHTYASITNELASRANTACRDDDAAEPL